MPDSTWCWRTPPKHHHGAARGNGEVILAHHSQRSLVDEGNPTQPANPNSYSQHTPQPPPRTSAVCSFNKPHSPLPASRAGKAPSRSLLCVRACKTFEDTLIQLNYGFTSLAALLTQATDNICSQGNEGKANGAFPCPHPSQTPSTPNFACRNTAKITRSLLVQFIR